MVLISSCVIQWRMETMVQDTEIYSKTYLWHQLKEHFEEQTEF